MISEFIDAEFYFPEQNLSLGGQLYIKETGNYFVLSDNPLGGLNLGAISISHVTTDQYLYTCVESILTKSEGNKYFFRINELYRNAHIADSTIASCLNITSEIHFLSSWLLPRMFDLTYLEEEKLYLRIDVHRSKIWDFDILPGISIKLEAYTLINTRRDEIKLREQSTLKIISDRDLPRNELFATFYTFLIFFTLFIRKSPRTTKLAFSILSVEVELLGLSKEVEESPFDILIHLKDIPNFDIIIWNYFTRKDEYNAIVTLWENSLTSMQPEIKFLHLTQSLELFHRTFYENDIASRNRVYNLISNTPNRGSRVWTQRMRYLHLLELSDSASINICFPLASDLFSEKLTKSRNYYTHYGNDTNVWGHFELYAINQTLKTWLRCLILHHLGVDTTNINKVAAKERQNNIATDVCSNKYSMRYQNDFTL